MTTTDRDTTDRDTSDRDTSDDGTAGGGGRLTLDDGPIHEALVAIDMARAEIEHAKAAFRERREAFAAVFRAELDACVDPQACHCLESLDPVVAELYWQHPTLRVSDITAATGLSSEQVRRIAGPRRREVACHRCATPTEVLQTQRTRTPGGLCADCRLVWEVDPGVGPLPAPGEPPEPDSSQRWWDVPPPRNEQSQWYASW